MVQYLRDGEATAQLTRCWFLRVKLAVIEVSSQTVQLDYRSTALWGVVTLD